MDHTSGNNHTCRAVEIFLICIRGGGSQEMEAPFLIGFRVRGGSAKPCGSAAVIKGFAHKADLTAMSNTVAC